MKWQKLTPERNAVKRLLMLLCKKSFHKIFAKFTRKHLYKSLFYEVILNLLGKRLWHRCLPVNFANFFKEHLFNRTFPATVSGTEKTGLEMKMQCTVGVVLDVEFVVHILGHSEISQEKLQNCWKVKVSREILLQYKRFR